MIAYVIKHVPSLIVQVTTDSARFRLFDITIDLAVRPSELTHHSRRLLL